MQMSTCFSYMRVLCVFIALASKTGLQIATRIQLYNLQESAPGMLQKLR